MCLSRYFSAVALLKGAAAGDAACVAAVASSTQPWVAYLSALPGLVIAADPNSQEAAVLGLTALRRAVTTTLLAPHSAVLGAHQRF